MKLWYTTLEAIDPRDGELKLWAGPKVIADTYEDAVKVCNEKGYGYLQVLGEYIGQKPYFEIGPERLN